MDRSEELLFKTVVFIHNNVYYLTTETDVTFHFINLPLNGLCKQTVNVSYTVFQFDVTPC